MPHDKSSRHHPTHSILHISSHLHSDLLPPFFSSLSQGHSLQYLVNENTWKHIQKPHTPSRKKIRFPKGRWTSKLLRHRSLQAQHKKRSTVNVLAKTDSLKTRNSLLRFPRKVKTCENGWYLQYLIEFFYPVILVPQPAAITPRLCPRLHTFISDLVVAQVDFFFGFVDPKRVSEGLQSWHEAKAKWTADPWAFHCSFAELPALSTGSSACQDCHSCPLVSDPHVTIQPTLFYMFA